MSSSDERRLPTNFFRCPASTGARTRCLFRPPATALSSKRERFGEDALGGRLYRRAPAWDGMALKRWATEDACEIRQGLVAQHGWVPNHPLNQALDLLGGDFSQPPLQARAAIAAR